MENFSNEQIEKKVKELRNAYMAKWNREHPEQARRNRMNFWVRKARKALEEGKE